jgi:rhomboid protease GluP
MELEGAVAKPAGPPWLTFALLAAVGAVFCCEIAFGLDPPTGVLQPSVRTLAAMGASNWNLMVGHGEWFRLISAPFLHGGLIHLGFNALVLLWAGPIIERLLGRAWFAALCTVSAVAGVLVSMAVNPPSVVSVGASGALMGLVACMFVVSFHFTAGPTRAHLQSVALRVLIPSLIPLATAVTGMHVDFGAHLGGAIGGAFLGLVLLASWPAASPLPRLRRLAAAIAAAGLAAAVATVVPVSNSLSKVRHEMELLALLIPNSEIPRTDADWRKQGDSLAARYPRDPRPRLFRGMMRLDAGDLAGAERELRAGLADAETFKDVLPQIAMVLRTNLATALSDNQRKAEAKEIAAPVCQLDTAETRSFRTRLKRAGLCD